MRTFMKALQHLQASVYHRGVYFIEVRDYLWRLKDKAWQDTFE